MVELFVDAGEKDAQVVSVLLSYLTAFSVWFSIGYNPLGRDE